MCAMYRSSAVNRNSCWASRVNVSESRMMDFQYQSHSGHPAIATSPDIVNHADAINCFDQIITNWEPYTFSQQWKCNCNSWSSQIFEGLHKINSSVSQLNTNSEKNNFCWFILVFWGRADVFLYWIVTSDETREHHFKPGIKGNQWSGIIHNHQDKRNSKQFLQLEKSWSLYFGHWCSDTAGHDVKKWSNQFKYIHQDWSNSTSISIMSGLTSKFENLGSNYQIGFDWFPIPYSSDLGPYDLHFFSHLKMHSAGQSLKMNKVWLNTMKRWYINRTRVASGKSFIHMFCYWCQTV